MISFLGINICFTWPPDVEKKMTIDCFFVVVGFFFQQLPPTDSRLRPDCRALENGDLGKMVSTSLHRVSEPQCAFSRLWHQLLSLGSHPRIGRNQLSHG